MRQRASPCAYPHGDTGEGNDAHDAERNLLLSMRGYVTKDLSTETGPSARILIAPRRLPRLPARTGFPANGAYPAGRPGRLSPPRQARRQQAACPHPAFQAKNALNCI